jgi:alkanesulfonate monooxygenase SsuD/methylene tetrahydromethanopterin reductase-like flavin-dependent oxidoreductase (luciferase family)
MALATSRIQLGTGILPVFSRHPTLAAMGIATLDDLSGGRMNLGIGAGHTKFRHPLRAVREFVEIVRLVMTGRPVRYAGRVFRVEDFTLEFTPSRQVPIFLAALRTGMLRLAGELGGGVLLNWATTEQAARAADVVRETAASSGREPRDVIVACFVRACVTSDVDSAKAVLRRLIASYAALPSYATMWKESGFGEDVAAIQQGWASSADAAAESVSDRMVESLGLIGSQADCSAGLEQFRKAGVDLPIVYPFPLRPADETAYRQTIEALAP